MSTTERGLAILALIDFIGAIIAGILGAFVASIVMLGLLVLGWLIWLTKEVIDLRAKPSTPKSAKKGIQIAIVQPKDWKNKDPKRKKGAEYRVPVPVRGVATGPIGAAYLIYHPAPAGDYRVIDKLSIGQDGAWSALIKIPTYDNNPDYEVMAIALPSNIELKTFERITIVDDMVLSNRVPVSISYEEPIAP